MLEIASIQLPRTYKYNKSLVLQSSILNNTTLPNPLTSKWKCSCVKVLVVDDDGFNLYAMKILLENYNIKIDTANNGLEAVERIENKHLKSSCFCGGYQLVFMDINMPIMNGHIATTKIMRKI